MSHLRDEYPLIYFHGRVMGSDASWIAREARQAKAEGAPKDAWAKIGDRWATIESCQSDYKPRLQAAWDQHQSETSKP